MHHVQFRDAQNKLFRDEEEKKLHPRSSGGEEAPSEPRTADCRTVRSTFLCMLCRCRLLNVCDCAGDAQSTQQQVAVEQLAAEGEGGGEGACGQQEEDEEDQDGFDQRRESQSSILDCHLISLNTYS